MIALIKEKLDRFFGRGEASIYVPVMDGPFKANEKLDQAETFCHLETIDNIALWEGNVFATSANSLYQIIDNNPKKLTQFSSDITAMTISNNGVFAIGLNDGQIGLYEHGLINQDAPTPISTTHVNCPTSLYFWDDETLLIGSGSNQHSAHEWKRDLMTHGNSGAIFVWNINELEPFQVLNNLAYPYGLVRYGANKLAFVESWKHQISTVDFDGKSAKNKDIKLGRLPAYPSRIIEGGRGDFWLTMFAPRNQLIEFILTEEFYKSQMIEQLDEKFWVAPYLRSDTDFREPILGGGVKQMGVLKPWAPAFSYGLVVHLDENLQPIASYHSRADGHVHGVTSIGVQRVETGAMILAGAKGDGKIIQWVEPAQELGD